MKRNSGGTIFKLQFKTSPARAPPPAGALILYMDTISILKAWYNIIFEKVKDILGDISEML